MTSVHWQTSLQTQMCHALCLGDNYSLTWRTYIYMCRIGTEMTRYLPPAYVVRREGTVFTGVCLSTGGGGYRSPGTPPGGVPKSKYPPPGGTRVRYTPPGGYLTRVPPRGGTRTSVPPPPGGYLTRVRPPPGGYPDFGTPPPPGGGGGGGT